MKRLVIYFYWAFIWLYQNETTIVWSQTFIHFANTCTLILPLVCYLPRTVIGISELDKNSCLWHTPKHTHTYTMSTHAQTIVHRYTHICTHSYTPTHTCTHKHTCAHMHKHVHRVEVSDESYNTKTKIQLSTFLQDISRNTLHPKVAFYRKVKCRSCSRRPSQPVLCPCQSLGFYGLSLGF